MKELGWEEGRDYRLLFLGAEGHSDRFPALVHDLLAQRVYMMVALGNAAIEAAKHASTRIPIVGMTDDMVKSALAASLAQPGSNTTGVSILASELDAKRLELLHEALPAAKLIGVIADPSTVLTLPQVEEAAHQLKLELVVVNARNREEVTSGLDALESAHVDAINVLASPVLHSARRMIVGRLNQGRLPAIYQWPETAEQGGLLAYGPRIQLCIRHVAGLVAKILGGARPEDLPVEQPEKFDFVVNLKTAKAIGITIPASILARADEVIE
jgi:putative tryptophan/tyrosine transport system substrate-binding protein